MREGKEEGVWRVGRAKGEKRKQDISEMKRRRRTTVLLKARAVT
jgi:hypothetical protein